MKPPNKKILICDDDEGTRDSLKLILWDFYDIIIVDNAQACLEVLKNNSPNIGLVLMGIDMGVDAETQIKNNFPKTPVMMVAGYSAVKSSGKTKQLDASNSISKPFKSEEILEKIRKHWK